MVLDIGQDVTNQFGMSLFKQFVGARNDTALCASGLHDHQDAFGLRPYDP